MAIFFIVSLLFSQCLFGQVGSSSLSGTVTDPSGAAVPNASVTLNSADRSFTRTAVTGPGGNYEIPTLPPGRFRIKVAAKGFVSQETEPFELSSGQAGALNVTLHIATQTSKVTVEATAALLQTTSASVGSEVSSQQLTNLPLLGRSFLNAISVEPGVIPLAPAGSTTSWSPVSQSIMPSVFGQRQKDNNFLIDGVDNRDPNLLGVALYPPPEAIAEMKIDSGVGSAAYGRASGATIDVVTKSGTNQWHGDGWEFIRNNDMDSRNFFTANIGAYHWSQFGGDIGGPLVIPHLLSKEKGWYVYGYYEGVRIHGVSGYTTTLPTAAEIQGNFSASGLPPIYDPNTTVAGPNNTYTRTQFPGNVIPGTEINSTSSKLAAMIYPASNITAGTYPGQPTVNYINNQESVTDGNQWSGRTDHQFSSRDTFFARYSGGRNPGYGASLPSLQGSSKQRLTNVELSETHVVSPHFVLTGRYSYMGLYYLTGQTYPNGVASSTGLSSVFPEWEGVQTLPAVSIQGYQGVSSNFSLIGPMREQTATGDAHIIKGNHNIDFGGGFIRSFENLDQYQTSVSFVTGQTSDFVAHTGDGFASFLVGVPSGASRQIGGSRGIMVSNAEGVYVQDMWKHHKLTVNGGLRYDYNSPPVDKLGLGTFDLSTGVYRWSQKNPITGAAANVTPGGVPPDRRNFAPRLGLAYSVTPKLVIRSSGGIFFNNFGSNYMQAAQSERGNWPFNFPQSVSGLNSNTVTAVWPNPFPSNPVGSPTPTTCLQCLNIEKSSSRTPYVSEWTATVQYQLSDTLMVEGAYFGSKGTKLTSQIIDDTATSPGVTSFTNRQPYTQFSPYVLNGFNEWGSWYDGAAFRVQKRFAHGFSYLVSYTYSHNLDYLDNLSNSTGVTSNPTRYNGGLFKGDAGFDIRHVLVASGIWQIPGRTNNKYLDEVVSGWKVSTIVTYHSGLPFSIFVANDDANLGISGTGRYSEYANLVGNPQIASPALAEWFNTAAFAAPATGTYGTAGRDILRTDHLINDDLSFSKSWKIRERSSFELRGDLFNLPNHPTFGIPDVFADDPVTQFGHVTSILSNTNARTIQISGEIRF
jgi:hypothetical protein